MSAVRCEHGGSVLGCEHVRRVRWGMRARPRAVRCQSASTAVSALSARSAVVHQSASTVVSVVTARSAAGLKSACTVVCAVNARSAVGPQYASTVVSAISASSAVGLLSASTVEYVQGATPRINESLLNAHPPARQRRVPTPQSVSTKDASLYGAVRSVTLLRSNMVLSLTRAPPCPS